MTKMSDWEKTNVHLKSEFFDESEARVITN